MQIMWCYCLWFTGFLHCLCSFAFCIPNSMQSRVHRRDERQTIQASDIKPNHILNLKTCNVFSIFMFCIEFTYSDSKTFYVGIGTSKTRAGGHQHLLCLPVICLWSPWCQWYTLLVSSVFKKKWKKGHVINFLILLTANVFIFI